MGTIASIAYFVLWGFALYELAKRRGLDHTWAAWVPFANFWTLGRLSDQYNKETANKTTHHGMIQLIGGIAAMLWTIFAMPVVIFGAAIIGGLLSGLTMGVGIIFAAPIGVVAGFVAGAPSIVVTVFMYIALWNVLKSLDVKNATLFVVLSVAAYYMIPVVGQLCAPIILLLYVMRKPETVEAAA